MSALEVREEGNGRWTWRYRESPRGKAFESNEDYDSPEAAAAAARDAYPDAQLHDGAASPTSPNERNEGGRLAGWLALVVVLLAWARRRG